MINENIALNVKVLEIKYPKDGQENPYGWYSLKTDKGIMSGNMPWRPAPNELLQVIGFYTEYKGMKQFKFKEAMLDVPINPRAQLEYVAERTKGMGNSKLNAIWELLGDNWAKMTIEEASQLKINSALLDNFKEQIENLKRDKEKAEAVSYLKSKGCSTNMATAAFEKWSKNCIGIINNDCFRLAELPNYGFKDIDNEIRHSFGIENDDHRRIKAAVLYCMKQLTDNGSTAIRWADLIRMIGNMFINLDLAVACVGGMFNDYALWRFSAQEKIALINHYNAEQQIFNFIAQNRGVNHE